MEVPEAELPAPTEEQAMAIRTWAMLEGKLPVTERYLVRVELATTIPGINLAEAAEAASTEVLLVDMEELSMEAEVVADQATSILPWFQGQLPQAHHHLYRRLVAMRRDIQAMDMLVLLTSSPRA